MLPDQIQLAISVKKLRQHLGQRPSGRDTDENLAQLLMTPGRTLTAAIDELKRLENEGYLGRLSGDRLQLTPKAETLRG
jgi:predicted KAP-like P-loop ATPase